MYCVYCGVKLQDGANECPLCHTPVRVPSLPQQGDGSSYSDRYPKAEKKAGKYLAIGLVTIIMIGVGLGCLIFCLKSLGRTDWSGFVAMGLALLWVLFILPLLFPRFRPMIFLPIDFACIGGYLLYICCKTGGNWFLSFAFPVTMIAAVLTLTGVAMMRYIVQGRLRLMSLLVIFIGLSFMLVEFF